MKHIDQTRIWRHADEIAEPRDRRSGAIDDVDRMWALFREAAQTSRWFSAPPRTGYPSKSAMPDAPPEFSHWQHMMAYLRGEVDTLPEYSERTIQPRPDAAAITRGDYVLALFHRYALTGRRDKLNKRKAVWAYAAGARAGLVRQKFGMSKYQLSRLWQDAMQDMLRGARINT